MSGAFYRVDKFIVPAAAREEFLVNVMMTHKLLEAQDGFIDHRVLEQVACPGEFNFVTIAEWENTEVVERAQAAVAAAHKAANFDPQEMFARLGIHADIAGYKPVAA
ncbi:MULTISPECIES: antibiotic biosynthesis monooxygenase family protein [Rhizobium]|uniref:antibiotic biosynthesis monooxygenase family protein n=1 Tax=Rhizobium TaxID=379 RepID=UPI00104051BC|nr:MULTISPECIES: antibiotic biosynthesis monooxygenase [Rhizobium]MBY3233209.1 antibiotic biosynthesis monooxygenase [Rhizobium laguerreae]MBY3379719.1 antibiotic biosynthesis monooxygenase [Rhizobium laguerreae]MDU0306292.1 antibiotic biosynthesis monooxygenase [Rhizobium sp. 10PS4]TBY06505.1 antibiotic biosynthesis monooxygenase [Rhizobium laguerreae]